ncbi:MAG: hypothetical protein Kow0013_29580 [Pararhodobacter sp.]
MEKLMPQALVRRETTVGAGLIVPGMVPPILRGEVLTLTPSTLGPDLALAFRVDGMGLRFALIASIQWLASAIYSFGYREALNSAHRQRFRTLFAASTGLARGVAFAANLLTLCLIYEAMTVATYFLIPRDETDEAHAGGRRDLACHLGTSIAFLLPAIGLTWRLAGTLDFAPGGLIGAETVELHRGLVILTVLLFLGGSAKVALMPLHGWLPAAMVAMVGRDLVTGPIRHDPQALTMQNRDDPGAAADWQARPESELRRCGDPDLSDDEGALWHARHRERHWSEDNGDCGDDGATGGGRHRRVARQRPHGGWVFRGGSYFVLGDEGGVRSSPVRMGPVSSVFHSTTG